MGVEIVGKPLRSLANGIDVHAIGTKPDDTAQAGRAKRELAVERVMQLFYRLGLFAKLFGLLGRDMLQPALVLLFLGTHGLQLLIKGKLDGNRILANANYRLLGELDVVAMCDCRKSFLEFT